MSAAILFGMLFVLMLVGMPIGVALGLTVITYMAFWTPVPLESVALKMFTGIEKFELLAIPFFILAGTFLTSGGVARRMIRFANSMVGHVTGGLGMTAVLACALFAAVSGSSPATVLAIGSILIPAMLKQGYSRRFAIGTVASAGGLGILIPPSIVMVMYAVTTNTSIGALFMAGVLPGLVLVLMLGAITYWQARKHGFAREAKVSWRERWQALREAFWGLLLIVIVMGGIYAGIFTATEAAAMSAVYAAVIALFVYRDMTWRDVPRVLVDSANMSSMLFFIIASASLFSFILTSEQIPQMLAQAIIDLGLGPIGFLLVVNVLLLLAGNLMEPSSIILILAPILFPVAVALGIDPIHFGVIMTVNMEIGMITPPVGLNLFVASGITGAGLGETSRAVIPWLLTMLVFLVLVTYWPTLSLALPQALGMM
ncbi:MAG: C4-dicarboxylate transporter, DctM subunit [Tepidiphilus sp.]|jgi:C4-dicarboxylate transporter DctM subunit|uniref:TRAP transporter large permease protein n=1 Tax=Tepidiphilus baoligensis TaxID=2698687 RepID=A0ABX1QJI9_9PROT|nr:MULTISPECIES: TRAP transporter large permease subunit [Tepidiphilus]MDK2796816.1 C4-dicarboxylate transporter, DctM subunit [Tepidiphilus sp.]NMH16146.1 TRAP transporter large permease subunit [Tepidiphilus baoligensis]